MIRHLILLAAALAIAAAAPASAQPDFGGPGSGSSGASAWRVGLDSLIVAADWQPTWRGFALGTYGARGRADFHVGGRPVTAAGDWGVRAHVGGTAVFDARPAPASDGHFGGGVTLSHYFNPDDGAVSLVADAYYVPEAETNAGGVEFGLTFEGVEWNWGLQEVNPKFAFGVYRDVGRFDALRADLSFRVGLGIQNVAFSIFRDVEAWVEARGQWSDYGEGSSDFDESFWQFGPGVTLDISVLALQVMGGFRDPHDEKARGWATLALRIWPDAADL